MKENNYKVAFFTLIGFVIGALAVTGVVYVINKDNKKTIEETNKVKVENKQEEQLVRSNDNSVINKPNLSEENKEIVSNKTSNKNNNADEELTEVDNIVIEYLEEQHQIIESKTTKEKAKQIFINTVDFLFYDGKIKGYSLKDLSSKGKMKASEIITKIEISIEKKFPGLIDTTKTKYKEAKEKIIEKYHETLDSFCEGREDTCKDFRYGYENMKSSFKNTFNVIIDIGEKGIEKGKNLFNNWYNKFKNN